MASFEFNFMDFPRAVAITSNLASMSPSFWVAGHNF